MSRLNNLQSWNNNQRAILIFGEQLWSPGRIIKECYEAGLQVVGAKLFSDKSEDLRVKLERQTGMEALPQAKEIFPDDINGTDVTTFDRLRRQYGEDWCVLPLNDYVTKYAAAVSAVTTEPCYPPESAEVVKRKHQLRGIWNRLASQSLMRLYPVEYCYLERQDDGQMKRHASPGFDGLPDRTGFIVKPDELSSSIEIRYAASKTEAIRLASEVCDQLLSRWAEVGRSIGTEVRPRIVVETAIERSTALHPGAEFSVEFVSFAKQHHFVGVTQKWTGPNFVEIGHLFPAKSFPLALRPTLETAIRALLDELAVNYAVSHWEFIVTADERIALVEAHLRPGGGRIMELVEGSTGRSPTAALCQALAHKAEDFSFVPERCCGLFWMVPQTPLPKVSQIDVPEEWRHTLNGHLYVNHEGIVGTPHWSHAADWLTRLVHVIVRGDDLDCVTKLCRQIAETIILSAPPGITPASTALKLAIDESRCSSAV